MDCGIYMIRCNPTQKIYVGKTSSFLVRWRNHLNSLNIGKHYNQYLQRAWDKYGVSAFTFEVLIRLGEDDLAWWESFYSSLLSSTDKRFGFNLTIPSKEGTHRHSEETKAKIGAAHRGKKLSDDHKAAVSRAQLGTKHSEEHKRKIGDSGKGKMHTEETKAKMSLVQKGHPTSEETKEKISAAAKRRYENPEVLLARSKLSREIWAKRRSAKQPNNTFTVEV